MDVVIMVMSEENVIHASHGGISLHIEDLLEELHRNNLMHEKVSAWAHATMKKKYISEILSLTKHSGLHYITKKMNENKLHDFDINDITERMSVNAPLVWELLDELLSADTHLQYKREMARKRAKGQQRNSNITVGDIEDFLDESVPIVEPEDELEDILDQAASELRHKHQIGIVSGSSNVDIQTWTAHHYI